MTINAALGIFVVGTTNNEYVLIVSVHFDLKEAYSWCMLCIKFKYLHKMLKGNKKQYDHELKNMPDYKNILSIYCKN